MVALDFLGIGVIPAAILFGKYFIVLVASLYAFQGTLVIMRKLGFEQDILPPLLALIIGFYVAIVVRELFWLGFIFVILIALFKYALGGWTRSIENWIDS